MVETDKAAVIKLFQAGHKQKQNLNLLKMPNGRRMFVYRTIKRYQETGTVEDKVRSGRPSSILTPRVKKAIREQIRGNPRRCMRKIALGMEISRRSVSRIVKNDLGMKSLKRKNGAKIPQETLRAAVEAFPRRLRGVIQKRGGYIE